jgi:hypothetical protein
VVCRPEGSSTVSEVVVTEITRPTALRRAAPPAWRFAPRAGAGAWATGVGEVEGAAVALEPERE